MTSHMWEEWDGETRQGMAAELLMHGAARANLARKGLSLGPILRADGGTEDSGVERQRNENECPDCGSEGVPNPVLDDWYECPDCVISFNADGEVDDEQR